MNLDLESPRMRQAMKILGYEKEDLNTRKRRENFTASTYDSAKTPTEKAVVTAVEKLNTVDHHEVDDAIINLRMQHYQKRLMDRINRVLHTRK